MNNSNLVKKLMVKNFSVCLFLFISLLFPNKSFAQFLDSRGPVTGTSSNNTAAPNTSGYRLNSGVECPSSTFNVAVFGTDGNDFQSSRNEILVNSGANAGSAVYGATMGFTVPIGGTLGDFCERYATARATFEETRANNILLTNYLTLIQVCTSLKKVGVNFNNEAFDNDPSLSLLISCRGIAKIIPDDLSNINVGPLSSSTEQLTKVTLEDEVLNINIVSGSDSNPN